MSTAVWVLIGHSVTSFFLPLLYWGEYLAREYSERSDSRRVTITKWSLRALLLGDLAAAGLLWYLRLSSGPRAMPLPGLDLVWIIWIGLGFVTVGMDAWFSSPYTRINRWKR